MGSTIRVGSDNSSEEGDEKDLGESKKTSRKVLPTAGFKRAASSYISPTRGSCVVGTNEALSRLTRNSKDKEDYEDEWIIIKVPKKMNRKFFFADFCDGDSEDEFQWLEGPYLQKSYTVADLLKIRAVQSRSARRRKGLTEFRDDVTKDQKDNEGKILTPRVTPRATDASDSASHRAGTPRWRRRFCGDRWCGRPPGPPSGNRRGNDSQRIDLRRGERAHRVLRLGKRGPKQSEVPALGPGSVLARKPRQALGQCRRQSLQTVGRRGRHP